METQERRTRILQILQKEQRPLSGTELARELGVSRQIIVQDIALLRATNKNILSTNKGYLLFQEDEEKHRFQKTVKVRHSKEETRDELYTIVDCGGRLLDVVVEHEIYGMITVDLIINSRVDVDTFLNQVAEHETTLLNDLTKGVHFHTIEADSMDRLDMVEAKLKEKGYLIR
ncbi:MAG: transcription repressor NadR [Lachnospiraceae bacterium]|nr:transcription repressor NadR [Lachnospiraceae bacterium]